MKDKRQQVPQYVFVISLHRTSTRSVDQLLKLLGYKTIHWPRTIDGINLEEKIAGKEDDLDFVWEVLKTYTSKYNAFSDVPYSVFFKKAYYDYPNAKFIYIYRDYSKWIQSVRQHFAKKQVKEVKGFNKVQYAAYLPISKLNNFNELSDRDLITIFTNHFSEVVNFFQGDKEERLGIFNLGNPNLGYDVCEFLGFPPILELPRIKEGYHPVMNNFNLLSIKEPQHLENMCLQGLEVAPNNPYFYALYSLALGKNRKLEEALTACEKAIEIDPSENLFRRIRIVLAGFKLDMPKLWKFIQEYKTLAGGNKKLTEKVLSSLKDTWKRKMG